MEVLGLDHIVLCVEDVERSIAFYASLLGMQPREERPGKWSLYFGSNKISLQDAASVPDIAKETVPGSGNFCLLTSEPVERFRANFWPRGSGSLRVPASGRVQPESCCRFTSETPMATLSKSAIDCLRSHRDAPWGNK